MCEIVRTLIVKGVVRDSSNTPMTLQDLSTDTAALDSIECAKYSPDAPGICAAAPDSYFQQDSWNIFFGGKTLSIFDGTTIKPKWRKKLDKRYDWKRVKLFDHWRSPVEEHAIKKAKKDLNNIQKILKAQKPKIKNIFGEHSNKRIIKPKTD